MSNRDDPKKYQERYPSDLSWNRMVWVLKAGDRLRKEDDTYKVKEVVKSLVKGSKPQIVVEKE